MVIICGCGIKTSEPYVVNGEKMCAVCAERVAPKIVNQRAARNWDEYVEGQRRYGNVPRRRYAREW